MPLVSICISAFNAASTIRMTLESILPLLLSDSVEIVFIDDGSTDDTYGIAESILLNVSESRKRIISQDNLGTAASRNRLIEEASGKWVYFLDADDLLLTENFEMLIPELKLITVDVLQTGYQDYSEFKSQNAITLESMDKRLVTMRQLNSVLDRQNLVREKGFWRYFYRRSFLVQLKGAFLPTFEDVKGRYILDDYYFLVRVANSLDVVGTSPLVTYFYRARNEGSSESYLMQIDKEAKAMEIFLSCLRKQGQINTFIGEELYYRFKIISQLHSHFQRINCEKFRIRDLFVVMMNIESGKWKKATNIMFYFLNLTLRRIIRNNLSRI